ncbi:unnamed protein product [Lathyrus oleraceus]|uniref:FRIGIDA-like protein n=1 Tax=Pisum sativum TaxID=3888 RepID=A0A9D5AEF0_PEA|nr:protein FRIGIDA [Pisum sativum]KAI5404811.1 hypothetical protein KIW84_051828 [Pisum sativum]
MEITNSNVSDDPFPPENQHDTGTTIAQSVNKLNDLSIFIQAFKNRYDELQNHLDFIEHAISTRTSELEALATTTAKVVIVQPESKLESKTDDKVAEQQQHQQQPEEEPEEERAKEEDKKEEIEKGDEFLLLCKTMNSRGLRRYILTHLFETALLKEQIPAALKTAQEPAKLVFECIGRFYLQGSKAYTVNSPMITARQTSVLVLEYYLISGCVASEAEMELSLKEEAAAAAVAWRKRLISEGGVGAASEMDARGLILFLACFGIPGIFRNEDIANLVHLSKPAEISHALRKSKVLFGRVSDITEGMMKKDKVVEAIELAYTFGFEEKFSPRTVLTSFLHKSSETWKKAKEARDDPSLLKKTNEKYLTALKSVINCLEGFKVDIAKLLPEWKLKDTILQLEKDISDVAKKFEDNSPPKRKLDKSSTSKKVKGPDTKRTRYDVRDPFMASPSVTTLQGQRIASLIDGNSSYDTSLTAHYLEGRSYGYPNPYSIAASAQFGSVSGSLPEGYIGRGVSIDNVGAMPNINSSLYSRLHSIDEGVLSYNRSVDQSFAGQPSSARANHLYGRVSAEGYPSLPDHHSIGAPSRGGGSDLYSFADSVFDL